MMRFAYDWLVLAPATLLAYPLSMVLWLTPLPAALGTAWLVILLMEPNANRQLPDRALPYVLAAVFGLYAGFVTMVAVARLPAVMFRAFD